RRVAATPCRALADHEATDRPSLSPVDLVECDEADMLLGLVENRPDEIGRGSLLDPVEELLFLPPSDPQVQFEHGRDLGVIEPAQCIFQVEGPVRWDQPGTLALPTDDRHVRPLGVGSTALGNSQPDAESSEGSLWVERSILGKLSVLL